MIMNIEKADNRILNQLSAFLIETFLDLDYRMKFIYLYQFLILVVPIITNIWYNLFMTSISRVIP